MREDFKNLLKNNDITLELKDYKEHPSSDGYFMTGNLYVNGKKAINFLDTGTGAGCEVHIINQNNAKPLLDIKKDMENLKAYPNDKEISHLPFALDDLFYIMADDLTEIKALKKEAKKHIVLKFNNIEYKDGEYSVLKTKMCEGALNYIIKKLENTKQDSVIIFSLEKSEWEKHTINDLKDKIVELNKEKIENLEDNNFGFRGLGD